MLLTISEIKENMISCRWNCSKLRICEDNLKNFTRFTMALNLTSTKSLFRNSGIFKTISSLDQREKRQSGSS